MKSYSILEVQTVLNPPIRLNFIDDINCPICDIEIDVKNQEIDDNSFIFCEDCNHTINFKLVKI
jgi:hypothetical protein|tara:strand:- start:497 stop:688 length:192 start_codon:yes stop_codon:yes gene_type:complete